MSVPIDSTILAIHIACWILWGLAAVAVALRFIARIRRKHGFGWDDHIMLLSLILNLVAGIFASYAATFGAGGRLKDVARNPQDLSEALYWSNVANTIGLLGDAFPKIAVALLANRVLTPRRLMQRVNLALPIILLILIVVVIIILWVRCQPVAHGWDPFNVPGSCWSPDVLNDLDLFVGSWGTFVDLYFVVYPSVVISRLQMPLRKRITASVVMGLGVASFFTTLYKTAAVVPGSLVDPGDITEQVGQLMLWTLLEGNTVIIAGSIPTWGWLVKTDVIERMVTWISLHSLGSRGNHGEQLGSQNGTSVRNEEGMINGHHQIETVADRRPGAAKQSGFDSIAALERSANR